MAERTELDAAQQGANALVEMGGHPQPGLVRVPVGDGLRQLAVAVDAVAPLVWTPLR
jgi:hypothetical protein